MAVTASLGVPALTVEPGGTVATEVTVRNDGDTAATVRLQVTGPGRNFSYLVPETLTVEPGGQAAARVGFRVPRTSLPPAGPLAFAVQVEGEGIGVDGAVTDGVVEVLPYSSLSMSIDPTDTSAKGSVRHTVTVSNRGNAPVVVALTARADDAIDVVIEPTTLTVAPDLPVTAAVDVTPRQKLFTGDEREAAFTIVGTPARGDAVAEASGRYRQQVAVASKTLVTSGVIAGIVVLALVLATTVFAGGSSEKSAGAGVTATTTAAALANDCPAKDHRDTYVSGQRPDDIPTLPNSFSFLFVKADGCSPVRFNPCEPLHYIQNVARAPAGGAEDVRKAFTMLGQATGITFIDDGTTDETVRRTHFLPDRYGQKWAPILVSWIPFGNQGSDPTIQSVGRGIGARVGDVLVSGQLSLNIDAVTNREPRTLVQPGFGPAIGTGVGAIGPEGVQWGRIILHELAHVMGLGHTRDKGAIMYPETADQTSRPAEFRPPDKDGLRYLGRDAGCLTTPPPA